MKGIVLATGRGTRLHPITLAVSKHLLPVHDKPLIYYPLSVLMLAGIDEILLISTPADLPRFRALLGDGSRFGIEIGYAAQPEPGGTAAAFVLGADHIGSDSVALILGDNIFHGPGLGGLLRAQASDVNGCVLFRHPAGDPRRHGTGDADDTGKLVALEEKPPGPRSGRAVTGLYLYDNDVVDIAKNLRPPPFGELEIAEVNRTYLARGRAALVDLGRGFAWLDAGTPDSLLEAGRYVRILEHRQGIRIACLEEIALRMGFIDADACHRLGRKLANSGYGRYVMDVARVFA
ncbi:glucose-1-phosphate thymidylyltransferase RfbA [Amycolatopsis sp. NPDC059090]|uniref:glucose-1-phosphate thymidylyltransferase RfbA n=1 Tax=unclassified Amycolatopsis TaxID=2618356 RepID=UPI00367270E1